MKNIKTNLDKEELDFLKSYEKWEWKSVNDLETQKGEVQKSAKEFIKKKLITIRINQTTLNKIKLKASQEWIPYQTFIWSILHKFVQ